MRGLSLKSYSRQEKIKIAFIYQCIECFTVIAFIHKTNNNYFIVTKSDALPVITDPFYKNQNSEMPQKILRHHLRTRKNTKNQFTYNPKLTLENYKPLIGELCEVKNFYEI